jgi:hypothetical protein
MKTCVLNGPKLDWAVAKALNIEVLVLAGRYVVLKPEGQVYSCKVFAPSLNWAQGGPIIEREGICIFPDATNTGYLAFTRAARKLQHRGAGATPLVAAMRCLLTMKLGEEVEIPENLFSHH